MPPRRSVKSVRAAGRQYYKKTRNYAPKRGMYTTVARTRGYYGSPGEMKYFDTECNESVLGAGTSSWASTEEQPNVGTRNTFFCPAPGSAFNQRLGRECKVHKIKIRGFITIPKETDQTTASDAFAIRYIFLQDTQTNASQVQGESVMADPATATQEMVNTSFQSTVNFGRFKILKDKTITVRDRHTVFDGTNIENNEIKIPFKIFINFKKPVSVRFNAVNGETIADIVDNSWTLLMHYCGSGNAPTITYNSRVCYKE